MPSGARIRANSVFGTVSDNPLSPGATTFNSNQLVLMPTVIGNHAIVTLDPLRLYGDPEIVIVTAHSAASTVATIQRGAYGTSAREHPSTTVWVHALIDEDCIEILTSASRPSDPYRGQMIFETDTDKFVARSVTDTWQDVIPLGAFGTWTPVVTQGVTPGQTITHARWTRHARLVTAQARINFTGAGTAGQIILVTGLPVVAGNTNYILGYFRYSDTPTTIFAGVCNGASTTSFFMERDGVADQFGVTTPTIANLDSLHFTVQYEAAT